MLLTQDQISAATTDDLNVLVGQVNTELSKRLVVARLPEIIAQQQAEYLTASGKPSGTGWVQPTGAHDAYPKDWKVIYKGVEYRSLIQANVWSPESYPAGWAATVTAPPASTVWAANQAVKVGDVRSYNSTDYKVVQAHTTQTGWEPPNVPALWTKV